MRILIPYLLLLTLYASMTNVYGDELCRDCMLNKMQVYNPPREKIVDNSRNIMIDFVRDNKLDSLPVIVHYCDSVYSPDSSWLTASERFLIGFINADSAELYNTDYYCRSFYLYNSAGRVRKADNCLINPHMYNAYMAHGDNLYNVLRITAQSCLSEQKKKYPQFADAWEFCELLVLHCRLRPDSIPNTLNVFRKHYPDSPLASLRFLGDKERHFTIGTGLMIGQAFNHNFGSTSELMRDDFSTILQLELVAGKWILSVHGDFNTIHTKNVYSNGTDTLSAGSPVDVNTSGLCAGRVFRLGKRDFLVPNAGIFRMQLGFDTSFTNLHPTDFKFSKCTGGSVGVDYNHFLAVSETGNTGMPLRLSFKVMVGDFSKIVQNAGRIRIYAGVLLGIFTFDTSE
jgi:hypothetical protein